jgi:hypothetical protein
MTYGAEKLGLDSEQGTISTEYILNNLSDSTPMICSMKPGDFTYTGHFIILTGIDSNGDIIVNDPNLSFVFYRILMLLELMTIEVERI